MSGRDTPIAVVGLSCRFPRIEGPEEFWRRLAAGEAVIDPAPGEARRRLVGSAGSGGDFGSAPGGYLERVEEFDADFFQMSPREAEAADPQQRLALELAWEALESSGDAGDRRDMRAGVFVGATAGDYADLAHRAGAEAISRFSVVGLSRAVIANRISYALGVTGPSVVVDAAQASSLVAVHQGCESLRGGEADLVLAGGVQLNLDPRSTVAAARFGVLSPDGRCFTFDARANGYVRGEGGGFVVLRRLADALGRGDRVLAVIRGSAVNNDGASAGFTVPRVEAQEAAVRDALRRAGVKGSAVQYVELHGTGTPVGDPIEAAALGGVLGAGRPRGEPLRVGSVKTNLGHLEGAAGIAGLIKTVLAVAKRELPPSLNFETPNPEIPLEELGLAVQDALGEWPDRARPLVAGVSSFGIGGTNAHVVLEEAPEPRAAEVSAEAGTREGPIALALSARDPDALAEAGGRLAAHLRSRPEQDLADVAFSLASGRALFAHRAVVLGAGREELLEGLDALASGERAAGLVSGRAAAGATAFMFTGQGAQRPGMGSGLYEAFPAFRSALDALCAEIDPFLGRSLKGVMWAAKGSAEAALLDRTEFTQPALFALEVSLFRLVESLGVRPDYLVGHSIGELAAAHVAGVLSLPDACRLVCARGRLMGALPEGGAMLAVEATEDEVAPALEGLDERVSVAAVNGPKAVVLSGEADEVARLAEALAGDGRRTKRLAVSHAFHSPLMDPMLAEFRGVAAGIEYGRPRIPVVTNLTGEVAGAEQLAAAEHWVAQVRGAVRFAAGIATLERAGATRFLELGPDGILAMAAAQSVGAGLAEEGLFVATMRRRRDEAETLLAALASVHVAGAEFDWAALVPAGRAVELPTYPFRRRRYWLEVGAAAAPADAGAAWELIDRDPTALVRRAVAAVLGVSDPEAIQADRPFRDLGFDSLDTAELRSRLAVACGVKLPPSIVFDHPTPIDVGRFLAAQLGAATAT